MQPGFMQLLRDDASFYFVQGKAVMIATGSWDITSIRQQVEFPVGVGPIPVPSPEGDPRWPYSKGPLGDISADAGVLMAITRESENPEVALDFLYFLTSKKMSQLWTDVSGWVPVVVGVEARDDARAFLPDIDSYPGGFLLDFSGVDSARAYGINVNRLVSSSGSREEFLERLEPEYDEALVSDLERNAVVTRDQNLRNDTLLGVLAYQASQGNEEASAKLDLLLQASAMSNRNYHRQKEAEAAFKSRR
jgi:raffinose/stachyose/melibiose transport system substrate-binding protein